MSLRKHSILDSYTTVEIHGDPQTIRRLSFAEVSRISAMPEPIKWGETIAASLKGCDMTAQEIVEQLDAGFVDDLAAAIWKHTNGDESDPK